MARYLIGIGSNLGNRREIIEAAVHALQSRSSELHQSRYLACAPVGGSASQGEFLNAAILLRSPLDPFELSDVLHALEEQAGRTRGIRWAARPLDLDLLLAESACIYTASLTVPHPRMMTRRFVLEPAVEVAADMVHPEIGWTVARLYEHLRAAPWFVVFGSDHDRVTEVAEAMAAASAGVALPLGASGVHRDLLESGPTVEGRLEQAIRRLRFSSDPVVTYASGHCSRLALDLEVAGIRPKLILVSDPRDSDFSRGLPSSGCQIPTVYLSVDREHALQDAVGAVHAMQ